MHAPVAICLWNKKHAQQRTPALSAVIYELLSLEEWLVQPVLTQHPKGSLTGCSGLSWGNMWLYSHCADQESQECSASHSMSTSPSEFPPFPGEDSFSSLPISHSFSIPCQQGWSDLSWVSLCTIVRPIWTIIHFPFDAFAPNISLTLKAVCP